MSRFIGLKHYTTKYRESSGRSRTNLGAVHASRKHIVDYTAIHC